MPAKSRRSPRVAVRLLAGLLGLTALRAQEAPPLPALPPAASPIAPAIGLSVGREARLTPAVRAVAKVLPAVVNISTERLVSVDPGRMAAPDPLADLFDKTLAPTDRNQARSSLGSGVIVDPHGLVLTNEHVVRRASRIIVSLAGGIQCDATPVATDLANDLALLRLEGLDPAARLTAIDFAAPGDLLLGETVVTVGNPYGLGHSVAAGVLSATGRKLVYGDRVVFDDLLQTDAAVNPGNSGGPLVNTAGELIGINLAIQRQAEGISFAIPLKRIEDVLGIWLIPSRFRLATCGLVPGTRIRSDGQTEVYLRRVLPDTPAATAGLREGDTLLSLNGQPLAQAIELSRKLWQLQPGDALLLQLGSGAVREIEVAAVPKLSGKDLAEQKLGLELVELTARLAEALRLPYTRGLAVARLTDGSPLAKRGVRRGDVLVQIGEIPVANFTDVQRALAMIHHGDVAPLVVHRQQLEEGAVVLYRYALAVPF